MRLLGVDVDGVIVDTHSLYAEARKHLEDPLDFWRAEDLYDNLTPMPYAVEKLEQLSQYFGIVFISRLKGSHHKSKVYFTKKWFPFQIGFIGTHEKWLMNDSVVGMIDDLPANLVKFDYEKRIQFDFDPSNPKGDGAAYVIESWEEFSVEDFCKQYLK